MMSAVLAQSQNVTVLQKYHYALYPIYRKYCPDQWFVVAPQIFYEIPGTFWQHFMANSSYTKVLQDIHECVSPCSGHSTIRLCSSCLELFS